MTSSLRPPPLPPAPLDRAPRHAAPGTAAGDSRTVPGPPAPTPLPRPVPARLLQSDLLAGAAAVTVLVLGVWVRNGGLRALTGAPTARWTSLAQLSGLLASGTGIAGLYLIARPKALEQRYGLDRLFVWHRVLGETMALLVAAHIAVSIVAWQADMGWWSAVRELTGRAPDTATATVGSLLVGLVTISSLRRVRRRMSYETWYFVHLLAYVGFALAFFHQISLGSDVGEAAARTLWIALHVALLAVVVAGRWGRLARRALRPLEVVRVDRVNDDTVALHLGGRHLARLGADAGQFFVLRPLAARLWWQAHPISLSNAPTNDSLRFTIKARGDASAAYTSLRPGTKVVVEGPYGAHTPDELTTGKVVMIAGGIGIAPVRSLLERLGPDAEPVVLLRARHADELVHLDEIRNLAARIGGRVLTLVGPTATLSTSDPFSAENLHAIVPDVRERQALLCGPERLLHAARAGLRAAGVAPSAIHYERPWW